MSDVKNFKFDGTPELTESELLRRLRESENGHCAVYNLEDDRKLIYGNESKSYSRGRHIRQKSV